METVLNTCSIHCAAGNTDIICRNAIAVGAVLRIGDLCGISLYETVIYSKVSQHPDPITAVACAAADSCQGAIVHNDF